MMPGNWQRPTTGCSNMLRSFPAPETILMTFWMTACRQVVWLVENALPTRTWLWTLVGVVSSVALVTLTCVLGAWLQSTTTNLLESKVALAESRDKAEQALTETAKLKAQAERLALVPSIPTTASSMTDAKGSIEWVNTGFTRVTGYSLEEVLGKKPGRLLQGERSDPRGGSLHA